MKWEVAVTDGVTMIEGPHGDVARVLQYNRRGGNEETARHARLIAAAPDLLVALEALVTHTANLERWDMESREIEEAKMAIAKAKG